MGFRGKYSSPSLQPQHGVAGDNRVCISLLCTLKSLSPRQRNLSFATNRFINNLDETARTGCLCRCPVSGTPAAVAERFLHTAQSASTTSIPVAARSATWNSLGWSLTVASIFASAVVMMVMRWGHCLKKALMYSTGESLHCLVQGMTSVAS